MANNKTIPTEVICANPLCGQAFLVGGRGRPRRTATFCSQPCAVNHNNTTLPDIKILELLDAVYLAGLFDGEGSIIEYHRYSKSNRPTLRVTITSTYKPVLDRVLEMVGTGTLVPNNASLKNPNHSDAWHWQCYSMNAVRFLQMLYPWLIIKRERAEQAICNQFPTIDLEDIEFTRGVLELQH